MRIKDYSNYKEIAHRSSWKRRRKIFQRLSSLKSDEIHVFKTTGLTGCDWYLEKTKRNKPRGLTGTASSYITARKVGFATIFWTRIKSETKMDDYL